MIQKMLEYKRPAWSVTERAFIARFIDTVPGVKADRIGNRYLAIGSAPTTLISCHTDTMHATSGMQKLKLKGDTLSLAKQTKGDVLGADDGAGVCIALQMIAAKVPALYVFHRGEEVGGIGSDFIAQHRPRFLDGIERAIAFDRRGYSDVITHQMLGRCCSDDFAWCLALELGMHHEPCAFGTFTDTANYGDIVPECTNVSVGYRYEHTSRETLNIAYLEALIDKLICLNYDTLPTVRDPHVWETWEKENHV